MSWQHKLLFHAFVLKLENKKRDSLQLHMSNHTIKVMGFKIINNDTLSCFFPPPFRKCEFSVFGKKVLDDDIRENAVYLTLDTPISQAFVQPIMGFREQDVSRHVCAALVNIRAQCWKAETSSSRYGHDLTYLTRINTKTACFKKD